jgi:hypothetical protein
MSKHDEADLILKLYELRREATMRQARDWYFLEFNPESFADFNTFMFGAQSGYVRMVISYWDMAAALVNHGAISLDLFTDTNGEYLSVFAKVEPFLQDVRAAHSPHFMESLEKLIDAVPNGRTRCAMVRERAKGVRQPVAASQAAAKAN